MQYTDHDQLGSDRAIVDDVGTVKCRPQTRREPLSRSARFGKDKRAVEALPER